MNYVLAIGILGCAVSYSSANFTTASPCSSDNISAAAAKCLDEYGLSTEYIKFQTGMLTAQEFKESCLHPEKYEQASHCILNVTTPCAPDSATTYEQSLKDSLAYCSDPQINFQCFMEYSQNRSAIESCVKSHWALTDLTSRTTQEITCYGRKVSIQCAGELLRPCDDYTATAIETSLKLSTPVVCYFYPDIVG